MAESGEAVDILFIVTHEESVVFLDPIIRRLHSDGVRVGLVTRFHGGGPPASLEAHLSFQKSIEWNRQPQPLQDLAHLIALVRLIARLRPGVIHVSTPKAGLLGSLAAFLCRRPCVYQVRGFRAEGVTGLAGWVLRRLESLTLRCATHVIFQSHSLREVVTASCFDAMPKSAVIGRGSSTGVDTALFAPGSSAERTEFPVVGYLGRIHPDKGIDDLLWIHGRLLEKWPKCRLLVVGGADQSVDTSAALEMRCRENPRTEVTGFVTDVPAWLRQMDLLVMPTRREGLPSAPLQAQACGVPVIGYAVTGMTDAVETDVGGILVEPFDREALLGAAHKVLGSPDIHRYLAEEGRRFVQSHFEMNLVVEAQSNYLIKLIMSHKVRRNLRGSRS